LRRIRVIPVLTIDGNKLVKTTKFKKPKYIGDPINAIKIFNDKEVDEIVILDITASKKDTPPNFKLIEEMASECFMPLGYGGAINDFDTAKKVFDLGVEKIILNTNIFSNAHLITQVANHYGSQSVVVSIDVKRNIFGNQYCYYKSGTLTKKEMPEKLAKMVEDAGAGEIILNNIDNEGTFKSFDYNLISLVSKSIGIPVVACGGASEISDFENAILNGASAVAAGSMFVFKSNNVNSVLINYPSQEVLINNLYSSIN
jgi:cyclase